MGANDPKALLASLAGLSPEDAARKLGARLPRHVERLARIIAEEWDGTAYKRPPYLPRCAAASAGRRGLQCGNSAAQGSIHCHEHGGPTWDRIAKPPSVSDSLAPPQPPRKTPALRTASGSERLFTVGELAEWLNVDKAWVYRQAQLGLLPCIKLSYKQLRFKPAEIEAYLAGRHHDGSGPRPASWRRR